MESCDPIDAETPFSLWRPGGARRWVPNPQSRRSAGRNTYPHKSLMWDVVGALVKVWVQPLHPFAYKDILRARDPRYCIRSSNEKKTARNTRKFTIFCPSVLLFVPLNYHLAGGTDSG